MVSEVKSAGTAAPQTITPGIQKQASTAAATNTASDGAGNNEIVTVTDLGQRLQKLSDAVADLPVVDQQRVDQFREALANGKYPIDDKQIAEKLTALENLLGRAG